MEPRRLGIVDASAFLHSFAAVVNPKQLDNKTPLVSATTLTVLDGNLHAIHLVDKMPPPPAPDATRVGDARDGEGGENDRAPACPVHYASVVGRFTALFRVLGTADDGTVDSHTATTLLYVNGRCVFRGCWVCAVVTL